MMIASICVAMAVILIAMLLFINHPKFGRLPRGERLQRIKQSPHFRDGVFHNEREVPFMTSEKSRFAGIMEFLFRRKERIRPEKPLPTVRTDLKNLPREEDWLVWFGHSSYLLQTGGKRILVDPVFYDASPVSFVNKAFKGTKIYHPNDMPDIDYLIITHDHWDHLDYRTVTELKNRIGKVVCGLGTGEHFKYWGFDKNRLIEGDWYEKAVLEPGFTVHFLPACHFSGRGLKANQTLWASFLLETPTRRVYIAGDGGYGSHFARIGKQFPSIDLAILENGQYNENWRYIHLMPVYMAKVAKELGAKKILTVHHSKYALSKHPWDEPLRNAHRLIEHDSLNVLIPKIGEKVNW